MTAKHTPGPWRMEPRSLEGQLQHWGITDGTGFDIATTITDDNAKLIAAAPALAEALIAYAKAHDAAAHAEEIAPEYPTAECDCDLCFAADDALRLAGKMP